MINFADIIIILIFLIFCMIGFFRGFMRSLTKLLGSFVSLILAMLLCNWVSSLVCLTPLDETMIGYFSGVYGNLGASMNIAVDASNTDVITQSLTQIGIPGFISRIFTPMLIKFIPQGEAVYISELFAAFTTQTIIVVSVTIILFVIIRLLVKLLNGFIKLGLKDRLFKIIDRILGFIFGAVKAFLLIFILLFVGKYFIEQPYGQVLKNQIVNGSISNKLYENNLVEVLWDKYVNIPKLLEDFKKYVSGSSSSKNSDTYLQEGHMSTYDYDTARYFYAVNLMPVDTDSGQS